jgi:hypothetical protein
MDTYLANPGLKEWAVVIRALRDGLQIIDLRKGGIQEEGHRFRIRASRFWLYDSYEHQRFDLILPYARPLLEVVESEAPPAGELRIDSWAEIVETAALTEPEQVQRLNGQHLWTSNYAEQRFHWRPKAPLLVLVLRVYRLLEEVTLPVRAHYAGCSSWVPMLDLPEDPRTVPSEPVLEDDVFDQRRAALHSALSDIAFKPVQIEGAIT